MTAIGVLMALLLLAYLGSFLVSGRSVRGFGLPSGSEYLALGAIVGPPVLGMIRRSALLDFEPIVDVLVGWLALIVGLDFGFSGKSRVKIRSLVGGSLLAASTFSIVFGAIFGLLALTPKYHGLVGSDRFVLAGGVAAACTETTRNAVRWVVERYGAKGPVSSVIAELTDCDHIVPILATAAIFALQPSSTRAFGANIPFWGWALATLVLGMIVGATASLLLGREFRVDESWGVLLGSSVMAIGIAARVGLSPLATMFITGITVSALTSHRAQIRRMVDPTEQAAQLPTLLLAGALLNRDAPVFTLAIIATAIFVLNDRAVAAGLVVRMGSSRARHALPTLGLGLLSSGSVAICVGRHSRFVSQAP
ncbi:MAG: potassium transporter Kef [Polyangiaceae bacterium]